MTAVTAPITSAMESRDGLMVREYSLTMPVSTRDRLLGEGMKLFAERGYRGTTVADIQEAAGLTGGSGALYKHFRSKRELLDEGMRQFLDELDRAGDDTEGLLPNEPRAALAMIAEVVWASMERQCAVNRIILRDLEQFPDLLDHVWTGVLGKVYHWLAQWLEHQQALGKVSTDDPSATASVLLSSLTYYRLLDDLIGRTPGDIDAATFASTWVDHALLVLHVES